MSSSAAHLMMGRSHVGALSTKARVQVKKTTAVFAKYIMKNYLILSSSGHRMGVVCQGQQREEVLGGARSAEEDGS
jgi:hypothetical protein